MATKDFLEAHAALTETMANIKSSLEALSGSLMEKNLPELASLRSVFEWAGSLCLSLSSNESTSPKQTPILGKAKPLHENSQDLTTFLCSNSNRDRRGSQVPVVTQQSSRSLTSVSKNIPINDTITVSGLMGELMECKKRQPHASLCSTEFVISRSECASFSSTKSDKFTHPVSTWLAQHFESARLSTMQEVPYQQS